MDFSMPGKVGTAACDSSTADFHSTNNNGNRNMILQQKMIECGFYAFYPKAAVPLQFIDVGWGPRETDQVGMFGNQLELAKCVPHGKPNVWWKINPLEKLNFCVVAFDADYNDERRDDDNETKVNNSHATDAAQIRDSDDQDNSATGSTSANPARNGQPYLLWLRVNVTEDMTRLSTGRDVARWQPPHPPPSSGSHRIFIAVFIQGVGEVPDVAAFRPLIPTNSRRHRHNFNLRQLARELQLKLVGCNCVRFAHDAVVCAKVVQSLRDEIILDPTGRKVIAEIERGVRKDFVHDKPKD